MKSRAWKLGWEIGLWLGKVWGQVSNGRYVWRMCWRCGQRRKP